MADIFHCLRMSAPADEVFRAVTEDELLRPWWASDSALAVRCVSIADGMRISWRCVDGPDDWIGTDITFAFASESETTTIVRLSHKNWREANDTFARCTTKWGAVLLALKSRVETPEPEDLDS